MNEIEMKAGDVVTCRGPQGYAFTEGKRYEVLEYQPRYPDSNFTWPAYVRVTDDQGREVYCHAHRFVAKENG